MSVSMNELTRKRLREKLAETMYDVRNASTRGTTHVLQDPLNLLVLSDQTGWWTYDLGIAMAVSGDAEPIFGAKVVPVGIARQRLLDMMGDLMSNLDQMP